MHKNKLLNKTKMKTKRFQIGIVIGMMIVSLFGGLSQSVGMSVSTDIIEVGRKPPFPGGRPRSVEETQFFAIAADTFVQLYSVSSVGEVDVLLVSTAGDYYLTEFDTQDGSIILPISGDTGTYTINVTTPDGQEYEGEFEI